MDLKQDIENLVQIYGPDKVKAAARQWLEAAQRPIPAEHFRVLSPDMLASTINELDSAAKNVISASNNRDLAYSNKAELVRNQMQLETDAKLTEAEAFMNTQGEGKEQYGMINGQKILLNNDTNRDAYRRSASAAERKALAENSGQIAAIDVKLNQSNDTFQSAIKVVDALAAKARLQAALLNYLSGRE